MIRSSGCATGWCALLRSCVVAVLPILLVSCGGPMDVDPAGQQIEFWHQHTGESAAVLDTLIEEFNRTNAHEIQVRGQYTGTYQDIYDRVKAAIGGKEPPPQLVVAYKNQAVVYHQQGALVDLDPYIESPTWGLSDSARADYLKMLLEQDRFEDAQLALRPNFSLEVLYYNADWLYELGQLQPPKDWRTFAELCLAARRKPFSKAVDGRRSVGFVLQPDASRIAAMVFSRRGKLINAWNKAYTFNTAAMRQSLAMLRQLKEADGMRILEEQESDIDLFARGQALFVTRSSSSLPDFTQAVQEGEGFELGITAVPYDGPGPVHNVYGGSVAVLSSTPEMQLASWLFLKWFTEPEVQSRWVQTSNYFPVRTSAAPNAAGYFKKLLGQGTSEPGVAGYPQVRDMLMRASLAVLAGANPEQTLSNVELEANKTLPQ